MILRDITASFEAGTSTAILGPSGSGKTTLLNSLASRVRSTNLRYNGKMFINNEQIDNISPIKHNFGYVTQFDEGIFEQLTVREQVLCTAQLSGVKNPAERTSKTLEWLGLEPCADVLIGGGFVRGISGGQKKKCSVANELVTDPNVIFFDEPTTGLDSKSALDVAQIVKMLASKNRTIIATIY